jgi:hypothetical protein
LGKERIWFENQLDPLPPEERVVVLRWLRSNPSHGGAVGFLRELGRALV